MGYETNYHGEIKIKSEECKKLIQNVLLAGEEGEFYRELFESEFDEKKGVLTIDEDRKNYEEEMEDIFSLIAHYDKEAKGEIIAEGEDGEDKEKFTISEGKVFEEEGFVAYKNKKNITQKYKKEDLEDIDKIIQKSKLKLKCEKCGCDLDFKKFKFQTRGYYEQIKEEFGVEDICENDYKKLKKLIVDRDKAKSDLLSKEEELKKEVKNDNRKKTG